MTVAFYESVKSRSLSVGRNDASLTAEFIAIGSTDETAIYAAALLDTPLSYRGLWRSKIDITPMGGGPNWNVGVDYSNIPANEALGLDPTEPTAPDASAALGPGHGFTTGGGTTKIVQSIQTVSKNGRIDIPSTPIDYAGAIGVTKDGVEGVEIHSPQLELFKEVKRAFVSLNYIAALTGMVGSVNDALFYNFAAGTMLYLGADGKYSDSDAWLITHKFAANRNRVNYEVKAQDGTVNFRIPFIGGWDYLWFTYWEKMVAGAKTLQAKHAYVEQVYPKKNFATLEIGA